MAKKKQSALRLRKLDRYSVVVTLIAVLVAAAVISVASAIITRHSTTVYNRTGPHICSCPMIPAGANPADYCRC